MNSRVFLLYLPANLVTYMITMDDWFKLPTHIEVCVELVPKQLAL